LYATNGGFEDVSAVRLAEGDVIPYFRKNSPIELDIRIAINDRGPTNIERLGKRINGEKLTEELELLEQDVGWIEGDVNLKARLLTRAMVQSVIPNRNIRRYSKPWFNGECYTQKEKMKEARRSLASGRIDNEAFVQAKKDYRKVIEVEKKKWDEREDERLLKEAIDRPYKYKKAKAGKTSCPISSERLIQHFREIARGESTIPGATPVREFVHSETQTYMLERANQDFTLEEVQEGIAILKMNKAEGGTELGMNI
jgi:hypothetical protein